MGDSPGTEAGRRLLAFWNLHRKLVHGFTEDPQDAIESDIAEVEREARAAALAAVRERVEALETSLEALHDDVPAVSPVGKSAYRTAIRHALRLVADSGILDDVAVPFDPRQDEYDAAAQAILDDLSGDRT